MIVIKIDEKCLEECSHVEIRKRKNGIAVVKIPKAQTIFEMPDAGMKRIYDIGIDGYQDRT